jgi:hypothetical protein
VFGDWPLGRPGRRGNDYIKVEFEEFGYEGFDIDYAAHSWAQLHTVVQKTMKLHVSYKKKSD